MSAEHTPGPWIVCDESDRFPGIEATKAKSTVVIFGDEEEDSGVRGGTHEEALANARLIAAAPDLLRELENLAINIENGECDQEDLDDAFKAIAKAKGKQ